MPASEKQPGTGREAPDTDAVYGRDDPAKESGQGRLDNNRAIPELCPDQPEKAVSHRQTLKQINAQDELAERVKHADEPLDLKPDQPDHSLLDEEPRGEDLTPVEMQDPQHRRHPRTEGRGGTP